MQKNTTQTQSSQPAEWAHDPLPEYMLRSQRRIYVVAGAVVGSRREEALEAKAAADEEGRFKRPHLLS